MFEVAGHFVAATLFESNSFPNFEQCLPTKAVESAATSFPATIIIIICMFIQGKMPYQYSKVFL